MVKKDNSFQNQRDDDSLISLNHEGSGLIEKEWERRKKEKQVIKKKSIRKENSVMGQILSLI